MEVRQGLPMPAPVSESLPPAGPRRRGNLGAAVGAGTYTTIYGSAPSQASYGEQVTIDVQIRNKAAYPIYIAVTGRYNGVDFTFSPEYANVEAGAYGPFSASFSMPNKDITVDIWSWYWTGSEWYQDDHTSVTIALKVLTPEFSGFGISDYSKL